jgi:ferritin-like metal-binding protein YciE
MADVDDLLSDHLADVHAMERHVLRRLGGLASATPDGRLRVAFERHRGQTEQQLARLEGCLDARGVGGLALRLEDVRSETASLVKAIGDTARDDRHARDARDAYVIQHLQIASYELLERLAERAGDARTAEVARVNRAEEAVMVAEIARSWDAAVAADLR